MHCKPLESLCAIWVDGILSSRRYRVTEPLPCGTLVIRDAHIMKWMSEAKFAREMEAWQHICLNTCRTSPGPVQTSNGSTLTPPIQELVAKHNGEFNKQGVRLTENKRQAESKEEAPEAKRPKMVQSDFRDLDGLRGRHPKLHEIAVSNILVLAPEDGSELYLAPRGQEARCLACAWITFIFCLAA